MQYASVAICGNRAQVLSRLSLTAGTVGATVAFTFDNSWDGFSKIYVWRGSGVTVDDTAATGIIPAQVLSRPGGRLLAGVYGVKDGAATATVWADLGMILPGAQPCGEGCDDALPVWAQLHARLEALAPEAVLQWPYPGCVFRSGFRLEETGESLPDENSAWVEFSAVGLTALHTNLLCAVPGVFLDTAGNLLPFETALSKDFEGSCGITLTVPKGAVTARMNIDLRAYHYGDPNHLAQYFALYREGSHSPLAGKRVLCIGDSITYLDGKYGNGDGAPFVGWQAQLRQRGALVDTFAWSGAILGHTQENATILHNHIRYSVEQGLLDVARYDIILVFGGTNDVFCGIGLDYFSANIHNTLELLRGYNPTAQRFMVNILPSLGDEKRPAAAIEAYNATLAATAAGLGVPVVDAYREMGVNTFTFGQFFYDTVHPNSRGMARLGRLIAGKLEGYLTGKGDVKVNDEDLFTATDAAAVAQRSLRLFQSPAQFGAPNDADLTAIATALPAGAECVFWINDVTFPAVFAELKAQGIAAPYGIVTLRGFHNVVTVKWDSYESDLTLVNRYSSVNGVGWAGWKRLALQEVAV